MIIAIDTETGGLDENTDALLSISACQYENPENAFTVFIDPDPSLKVHEEAAKVNGYTPELWKKRGAVPLLEAMRLFKRWLPPSGNSPLAHNASFDKKFIEAAERQTKFKLYLPYHWQCSMVAFFLANKIFDFGAPNFRLETLARMAGHWGEGFVRGDHQSSDDVLACVAGYKWIVQQGLDLRRQIERLTMENNRLREKIANVAPF